jgi:hypothetical protein
LARVGGDPVGERHARVVTAGECDAPRGGGVVHRPAHQLVQAERHDDQHGRRRDHPGENHTPGKILRVLGDVTECEQERHDEHPSHDHIECERPRSGQQRQVSVGAIARQDRGEHRDHDREHHEEIGKSDAIETTDEHEAADGDDRRQDRLQRRDQSDREAAREEYGFGHRDFLSVMAGH